MGFKRLLNFGWTAVKLVVSLILNFYFVIAVLLYLGYMAIYTKYSAVEQPLSSKVPQDAVLKIDINDDEFREYSTYGRANQKWLNAFKSTRSSSYSFSEQLYAVKNAAEDSNVKAVVVNINQRFFNQAQAYELQEALVKVRNNNKEVYVFVNGALTQNELLIASAGTKRFVSPSTTVRLFAPIYGRSFLKGFYDKFDIDFIGQRMSLYKDYILDSVKYQVDEDVKSTFDSNYHIYYTNLSKTAENYGKPLTDFNLNDDQLLKIYRDNKGNSAVGFQKQGWYDEVLTPEQFSEKVVKDFGAKKDSKTEPNYVSLSSYTNSLKNQLFDRKAKTTEKHIAYLSFSGDVVYMGKSRDVISLDNTLGYLRSIYYNANNVAALVIRVDTGGGSALTGEMIRDALADIRSKGIPIVISQGGYAASAGYMISSTSDYIYSTPLTLTGSIGVVQGGMNVSRMLKNFDVTSDTVGLAKEFGANYFSTPFGIKGFTNPYAEQQAAAIKAGISTSYLKFITSVYEGRKAHFASVADVNRVAQGHVWGGDDAYKLGLVDGFGGVEEAIQKARELYVVTQKKRKTDPFSKGEFKVVEYGEVDKIPVIYFNAAYKTPLSSTSIAGRVVSKLDELSGGKLTTLVDSANAFFSLNPYQVEVMRAQAKMDKDEFQQVGR